MKPGENPQSAANLAPLPAQSIRIDDRNDSRLDPYRELKKTNQSRSSDWFIAEGKMVVRRLLTSRCRVRSVLLSEDRLESFGPQIPAGANLLVVPHALVSELVGFQFHAGVLACAERPRPGDAEMDAWPESALLVACPDVMLPDNMGSILRSAAAFGASALITGPQAADPYSRRAVRVSMGNIFQLDVFQPPDLRGFLQRLVAERGFEIVGGERIGGAEPLDCFHPAPRTVLMLGNEAHGIGAGWQMLCRRMVQVEMSETVDSLNVSTAAAILLYGLSRRRATAMSGSSAPVLPSTVERKPG